MGGPSTQDFEFEHFRFPSIIYFILFYSDTPLFHWTPGCQRLLFWSTTRFKLVTRTPDGGPAELIRMVFSYGNISYETEVLDKMDWKSLLTKTPQGNLPVLWVDHCPYGEPNAIVRHLASHVGLLGRSEDERLVVEAVLAQVEDIRDSDVIQKAFEEISEDRIDDNAELLLENTIPAAFKGWSKHIQSTPPGPFITASGISLADLAIYDFLSQHLDYLPLEPELVQHVTLMNLLEAVSAHPRMKSHGFKAIRLGTKPHRKMSGLEGDSLIFTFQQKDDM